MTEEIGAAAFEAVPGTQIAGYQVEAEIGRGGMAIVYRALDGKLGRAPEMSSQQIVDMIGQMQPLGVTWVTLPHIGSRTLEEYLDKLEAQAHAVIRPTHG